MESGIFLASVMISIAMNGLILSSIIYYNISDIVMPHKPQKTSISEKIRLSAMIYEKTADLIKQDKEIMRLLRELNISIEEAEKVKKSTGLAKECEDCAKGGGGCCGRNMEAHYGIEIILINLLMGVKLYQSKYKEDSCHFLGEDGCILKAREVICVNFLCERIYSGIPLRNIILFQEVYGIALQKLFYLEEKIKMFLRRNILY